MSKTLAEILGWEEGATYELEGLYYSIVGVNLYYFKDFESPRIKFYQDTIIDLLDLVNEAERVEPKKYYLKHKYLIGVDVGDVNRSVCSNGWFFTNDAILCHTQMKFTEEEIKELENEGLVLENYRKVEVEDE